MTLRVRKRASRGARVAAIALMLCWCVLPVGCGFGASAASGVAAAAQAELDSYADGSDGEKYWRWIGFSSRVPWCASFTSYVADQAGLTEAGYAPKNASVAGWIDFYRDNPQAGTLEDPKSYKPQSGDFIIWQGGGRSHIGVVAEYDAGSNQVTTIEGNSSRKVQKNRYDAGACDYYAHPAGSGSASGGLSGCSAAGGSLSGRTIDLPAGLGDVHTYMGWQLITAPDSAQYRLREQAGMAFDDEGFAKIDGRYVVACTSTFGKIGDYIDFYQEDGTVIQAIMGDEKNQSDAGCNEWGHMGGRVVVEFVVDRDSWYGSGHANPGTSGCHPEWAQRITKAVNGGSYFDGVSAPASGGVGNLFSCSFSGSAATASEAKSRLNLTEDYSHAEFQHGDKPAAKQRYIVLHDTEMDADAAATVSSWANSGNGVAAHFVVNRDGSVVQCVPLDKIAHHAGYGDTGHNGEYGVDEDGRDDRRGTGGPPSSSTTDYGMNSYSIGIEMVHVGGGEGYTDAQLQAVDGVIAYIDAYYGSPSKIIDHKAWRSGNSDTSAEFSQHLANYQSRRTH